MDEGTPLLAVQEESKVGHEESAGCGTYLIIFIASICFIHLGLWPANLVGQRHASHGVSTARSGVRLNAPFGSLYFSLFVVR